MTIETHAHHLFDAFSRNAMKAGPTAEAAKKWTAALKTDMPYIRQSPIYVLRGWANELFDGSVPEAATRANMAGEFRLPHPSMLVEMSIVYENTAIDPNERSHWLVFAHQQAEHIGVVVFDYDVTGTRTWYVLPAKARFRTGQECVDVAAIDNTTYDYFDAKPHVWERISDDVGMACSILFSMIYAMNAPAIEIQSRYVAVPKDINRGRTLLKKSRVPNHTVLTLPKVAYVGTGSQHGTHASPKTHWRRPHKRHYASGKVVDIPEILVNPGEGDPPPYPLTEVRVRHPELLSS